MEAKEIIGSWQLIEVTYTPTEDGEDDGGFADEGEESSFGAGELGLGKAYLDFAKDGSFSGIYWSEEKGAWKIDGGKLLFTPLYSEPIAANVEGSLLTRPDFDEEHGRTMVVSYEKVTPKRAETPKKLTKKLEKKIERFMNPIYECDHLEVKKLREILKKGGEAAVVRLQEEFLLEFALRSKILDAAKLLLEHGFDPNIHEVEPPLSIARRFEGKEAEAIVALLLEKGARE